MTATVNSSKMIVARWGPGAYWPSVDVALQMSLQSQSSLELQPRDGNHARSGAERLADAIFTFIFAFITPLLYAHEVSLQMLSRSMGGN